MNKEFADVYYDALNPGSFATVEKLRQQVREKFGKPIRKTDLKKWTSGEYTYTIHKKVVRKFKRRKTISKGIGHQFQADLIQFDMLSRQNSNFNFILICIDVFTRKVYAEPIKRKTGVLVAEAMDKIFTKSKILPKRLQVDFGPEFYNRHFESLMKKYNVKMFSVHSSTKASLIERAILTLKRRLFKWMTHNGTKRFLEILPQIIHSYNHTRHKSTGLRPVDITKKNEKEVWIRQYADQFPLKVNFKFKVGQRVRLVKDKKLFEKSYLPGWSSAIYTIVSRRATSPVTYQLKNAEGQTLNRAVYEQQIQLISEPEDNLLAIDVIKSRSLANGQMEHFIHYSGWPKYFDRWISSSHVKAPAVPNY